MSRELETDLHLEEKLDSVQGCSGAARNSTGSAACQKHPVARNTRRSCQLSHSVFNDGHGEGLGKAENTYYIVVGEIAVYTCGVMIMQIATQGMVEVSSVHPQPKIVALWSLLAAVP